jgi:molybdopterin-containing oxidoreductase family iron-sulfur binding subunit
LEIFNTKDAEVWNEVPMVSLNHEEAVVDLWDSFDRSVGHHFNLLLT